MYELILASQSPRRRQLLKEAGYRFRVHSVKVSENIEENLNPDEVVQDLARRKAKAALDECKHLNLKGFLILAADTLVVLQGQTLGQPQNFEEAVYFLTLLSGKTHSVMTGFCLLPEGQIDQLVTGICETLVEFRALRREEIEDYVRSGEPMDKAGAYAIQGGGAKFVRRYEGSWSNVVGLPLEKLKEELSSHGWIVHQTKPK